MNSLKKVSDSELVSLLKEQIRQGGLSLSVASQLQGFFQAEKRERQKIYSQDEKRELLQKIRNSSCSQVERTLKALSPESVRVREKKRFVRNRCQSRHQLEVDHIRPVAFGGGAAAENLRVLCKSHNIRAAFKTLGPVRMQRYFQSFPMRRESADGSK